MSLLEQIRIKEQELAELRAALGDTKRLTPENVKIEVGDCFMEQDSDSSGILQLVQVCKVVHIGEFTDGVKVCCLEAGCNTQYPGAHWTSGHSAWGPAHEPTHSYYLRTHEDVGDLLAKKVEPARFDELKELSEQFQQLIKSKLCTNQ